MVGIISSLTSCLHACLRSCVPHGAGSEPPNGIYSPTVATSITQREILLWASNLDWLSGRQTEGGRGHGFRIQHRMKEPTAPRGKPIRSTDQRMGYLIIYFYCLILVGSFCPPVCILTIYFHTSECCFVPPSSTLQRVKHLTPQE